jgi:hypothetical protein
MCVLVVTLKVLGVGLHIIIALNMELRIICKTVYWYKFIVLYSYGVFKSSTGTNCLMLNKVFTLNIWISHRHMNVGIALNILFGKFLMMV